MKHQFIVILLLASISTFGQKLDWIPFSWVGDSISGRYFEKLAITIPVTIDHLPHKFNMQFDLGAVSTEVYGNSIQPYLDKYTRLNAKTDTILSYTSQNKKVDVLKGVALKLGNVSFGKRNIGNIKNYGAEISRDSVMSTSEKHIGTIAPDLFQNKVLIIDYKNKRLSVAENIPRKFRKASFQKYKIKDGRIKIPFTIDGKSEDLMFDTGSSLFALTTTKENSLKISEAVISDSFKISSWGEYYMVYGQKTNVKIKFGSITLKPILVYYDELQKYTQFYKEEQIWGITGNAYFFDRIVIIDYKNNLFGVI